MRKINVLMLCGVVLLSLALVGISLANQGPDIDINPTSLSAVQPPDETTVQVLNIGNLGGEDLVWSLYETPMWSENFDSYEAGSQMHGQGGWKGWANDPAAGALVSDAQAHSPSNSVAIVGASDLVHEYSGYTSGDWIYTAWQFVPNDFSGQSYFILLNQYDDAGATNNWSVQVYFDGAANQVVNTGISGGVLGLIKGTWVELRVEIDLTNNIASFYYANTLLYSGTWTEEVSGGGILNIAAVDLYANSATTVYYDDISLTQPPDSGCMIDGAIPWLCADPTEGITPPENSMPVNVYFDSTGLSTGVYTGTLYAYSNDPDEPEVPVDVMLTVAYEADLAVVKSANADEVRVGDMITYTLVVSNAGPHDAVGVLLEDNLPDLVTFVSASEGCSELEGLVTCDIGDLTMGVSTTLTITVNADIDGIAVNIANVPAPDGYQDPNPEDNTSEYDITISPSNYYFSLPLVQKN